MRPHLRLVHLVRSKKNVKKVLKTESPLEGNLTYPFAKGFDNCKKPRPSYNIPIYSNVSFLRCEERIEQCETYKKEGKNIDGGFPGRLMEKRKDCGMELGRNTVETGPH